jgi:hypothetical protein
MFPLPRPRFPRWGFLLVGANDLHHGGFIGKRAAFNIEVQVSPKQEKRNRLPWTAVEEDI